MLGSALRGSPTDRQRSISYALLLLGLACDPVIVLGDAPEQATGSEGEDVTGPDSGRSTGQGPEVTEPDGEPRDGGSSAPVAQAPDAGGSTHCPYLLCEEFEGDGSGTLSMDEARGATQDWVSAPVAVGGSASRHTVRADQSWSAWLYPLKPALTGGSLYLRAFIYLPEQAITGRLNFLGIENEDAFNVDVNLFAAESGTRFELFLHEEQSRHVLEDITVPFERWFCLRVEVQLGEGSGGVAVRVDEDTPFNIGADHNTLPPGGVDKVALGIFWTEAGQTSTELFIDAFAIGLEPIPCR